MDELNKIVDKFGINIIYDKDKGYIKTVDSRYLTADLNELNKDEFPMFYKYVVQNLEEYQKKYGDNSIILSNKDLRHLSVMSITYDKNKNKIIFFDSVPEDKK